MDNLSGKVPAALTEFKQAILIGEHRKVESLSFKGVVGRIVGRPNLKPFLLHLDVCKKVAAPNASVAKLCGQELCK